MAFVLPVLFLAACTSRGEKSEAGAYVADFSGAVASDEPRATLIARNVLLTGGNAADAATALYFTLSVTMPGAAGLGGGGICLVGDVTSGDMELIDFQAPTPSRLSDAEIENAVPANPLGFFALHARYGQKNWAEVLVPAERLARFGTRISRAMAANLASGDDFSGDPELARIFTRPTGGTVQEYDFVLQEDLSKTLDNLRRMGVQDFYTGDFATQLIDRTVASGGSLSADDLSRFRPRWESPRTVDYGNMELIVPTSVSDGATIAVTLWRLLDEAAFDDAAETDRAHMLAEMTMRSAAWLEAGNETDGSSDEDAFKKLVQNFDKERHLPAEDLAFPPQARREAAKGTGFVVVDRHGGAVACSVSMNETFGTKIMLPGMGFLLAAQDERETGIGTSMTPMILRNRHNKNIYFVGATGEGPAAPSSLVSVAARVVMAGQSLDEAVAYPRIYNGGQPDVTFYEKGLSADQVAALNQRGHRLQPVKQMGRVNAISCVEGLPAGQDSCRAKTDSRGHGLAFEGR